MAATDQEEKLKWAKTGILNVIISLVAIKVIDYLFYSNGSKYLEQMQQTLLLRLRNYCDIL